MNSKTFQNHSDEAGNTHLLNTCIQRAKKMLKFTYRYKLILLHFKVCWRGYFKLKDRKRSLSIKNDHKALWH